MDVTIVNVALPAIQEGLHTQLAGLQWIVDAYTLVVASFLILSGSIADRLGRRKVFQIGLGVFTAASLLCSCAGTIEQLIGFRALQGLGASMLNPVALSIIANEFPEPQGRARAVGIWSAVAGVSLGLGPVIGGVLTEAVGWRSIFWINVPAGIAAALLAARFVPESRAARAGAFDPVGQALVLIGLAALTGGVIEGPRIGWESGFIFALFGTAAAALAAFMLYEPRRRDPLLDLRFFRSVPFSSATLLAFIAFSCFAGFLFLNTLYLQQVRGFSAFRTGLSTLPLAIMMMVSSPWSGRLVGCYGARPSLLAAACGFVASTVMLTGLGQQTPLGWLLVAYALFGVGLGMVNPAISNSAVAGMPLSRAGVGSHRFDEPAGRRSYQGCGVWNRGAHESGWGNGFHDSDSRDLVDDDGVWWSRAGARYRIGNGVGAGKHRTGGVPVRMNPSPNDETSWSPGESWGGRDHLRNARAREYRSSICWDPAQNDVPTMAVNLHFGHVAAGSS
jgi:EmrB/QacA subfamily drug resistance transporter